MCVCVCERERERERERVCVRERVVAAICTTAARTAGICIFSRCATDASSYPTYTACWQQCAQLRRELQEYAYPLDVELVVVSPLTRTLQVLHTLRMLPHTLRMLPSRCGASGGLPRSHAPSRSLICYVCYLIRYRCYLIRYRCYLIRYVCYLIRYVCYLSSATYPLDVELVVVVSGGRV